MQQNATMQAQWEKLGFTDGAEARDGKTPAADLIATRFDYSFEPIELGLTALDRHRLLLHRLSLVEEGIPRRDR